MKRSGTLTGILTFAGEGLLTRWSDSVGDTDGGLVARNKPLPGSRADTDLDRLGSPSLSGLLFSGLLSSLTFCSQKEKRDEKAMLADLRSWAVVDEMRAGGRGGGGKLK